MKKRRLLIVTLVILALLALVPSAFAATLTVDGSCVDSEPDGACDGQPGYYKTIQAAINAAAPGDTISIRNGTYAEKLSLAKDNVTISGQSEAGVIIDGTGTNGYHFTIDANGVTLENFTLNGHAADPGSYGIKASGLDTLTQHVDFTIQNVTVNHTYRSGIDINGLNGVVVDNVTVRDVPYGVGVAFSDCDNVVASNITTSGNAWGGVAIYTWGRYYPLGSDNIVLSNINGSEANPLYVERGNYNDPGNPEPVTKLTLPPEYDYMVENPGHRPGGENFTFYQKTESDAITLAQALNEATDPDNNTSVIWQLSTKTKVAVPIVVTEANVGVDWARWNQAGAGEAIFVEGPGSPPLGNGSLQMATTGDDADKMSFFNGNYGILGPSGVGIPLAAITELGYSTYTDNTSYTPTLQLEIDPDGPATTEGYTTVNFEPVENSGNTVLPNTWQSWDVINHTVPSIWDSRGLLPSRPVTWAGLLAAFPNATVKYAVGANVGSGWHSAMTGNVDGLRIGTADFLNVYDFELASVASNPADELIVCGGSSDVTFSLNGVADLYGYQFDVAYDSSLVTAVPEFVPGFFAVPTEPEASEKSCDPGSNTCTFWATKLNPSLPVTGSGPVAKIALAPVGSSGGTFDVTISNVVLTTLDGSVIPTSLPEIPLKVNVCGEATVSGNVRLQGRTAPFTPAIVDVAKVKLIDPNGVYGPAEGEIDANGNYSITVDVDPDGTDFRVEAAYNLYISNAYEYLTAVPGANTAPATRLLGGDATLSDGTLAGPAPEVGKPQVVNILDLSCMGNNFGTAVTACAAYGSSDINDDGATNIQDLSIAGGNYEKFSFLGW